jgi:hypothetical protein
MHYLRALVLFALQALPAKPAIANILSLADYANFYNLDLKTRPLREHLSLLIVHQSTRAYSPHCLIEVSLIFSEVMSKINSIGTLVALAAKMSDSADELQVIQFLSVETRWFPGSLKNYQTMLNDTMSYCSADDAASAKSQEILRGRAANCGY